MNFNYDTGTISVLQYLDPTVAAPLNGSLPANTLFINGPGAIQLPDGTTAQRPVPDAVSNPAAQGMFRFNSSNTNLEYFDGLNWQALSYASGAVTSFQTSLSGLTPSTATTGAVTLAGVLGLSSGGTGTNLTNVPGAVVYGGASTMAFSSVGTTGFFLTSNGAGAPTWSDPSTSVVTSVAAGTGISVSGVGAGPYTGAVTVTNAGVTSFSAGTTGFSPSSATTGAVTLSGLLGLANGGTNSNTAGSNGSIMYNNGTAIVNSTVGMNNQALLSTGAGAPTWLSVSSTLTTNEILQGNGSGAFTANGGTFVGSPSYSGVTLDGTVTNANDATTKAYVDAAVAGLNVLQSVDYLADSTNTQITGSTYTSGTVGFPNAGYGVGAILTGSTFGAINVDSSSPILNDRILVNSFFNGAESSFSVTAGTGSVMTVSGSVTGTLVVGQLLNFPGAVLPVYVGAGSTTSSINLVTQAPGWATPSTQTWGAVAVTGTRAYQNGIYTVTTVGNGGAAFVLTRATDYNNSVVNQITAGGFAFVYKGTNYASTGWVEIDIGSGYAGGDADAIVIGTDKIYFTQFSGAGTYLAGSGLTLTGNTFSVNTTGVTTFITGNNVAVKSSSTIDQVLLSQGAGNEAAWGALPLNNANAVSGVLNLANGGTGTSLVNVPGAVVYGSGSGMAFTAAGTSGQVLVSQGTGTPVWQDFTADAVTSFQTTLSGLTPNTPTMGAVTLSGTLGVASGGTGATATPTNGQILVGNGTSFSVATLGTSTGISTTVGAGTLTINNTGVTSLTNTDGNITFSSSTGAITANLASTLSLGAVTVTSLTDSGLTNTNGAVYVGPSGLLSNTSSLTNGQIMIGSTSGVPTAATLTAGTGISIANGANSITVSNTGVLSVSIYDTSTTPIFTISPPVVGATGNVTVNLQLVTETANTVFAGPYSGAAVEPNFRLLGYNDLPIKLYVENPQVGYVAPTAAGNNSVAIGSGAAAPGIDGLALGNGANAYLYGGDNWANGSFSIAGDAQGGNYVLRGQTSDATADVPLYLDGAAATHLMVFPLNSCVTFDIMVVGLQTNGTAGAGYRFVGVTLKGASQGTISIIGNVSKTVIGETVSAWDAICIADPVSGALQIQVTGAAATDINWVATARTTETRF